MVFNLNLVDQRIDEHHEIERLEFKTMEPSANLAVLINHYSQHAMHKITICYRLEFNAIGFGQIES